MGKETKGEAMGKVYREFSRQKYNKYKAQFPKLRESEIVSKIIREWDSLDLVAKDNLQKIYERKNYLSNEDISSSEALAKADLASKEARVVAEKTARKSVKPSFSATKIHSNVKAASRDGSDFNKGSEHRDDSRLESSTPQVHVQKHKPIAKVSQSDYINFYKHHYRKLSQEHKRWTSQQISSVVKLLWKKQKGVTKTQRKRDARLRLTKPLSGYRYFRKTRVLDRAQSKYYWHRFPKETKNFWENESKGIRVDNSQVEKRTNFSSLVNNLNILSRC